MVVGVMELTLAIPAFTLKDKRSIVRRVVARTKQRFNVSVAEVDELDNPGGAVLGIVSVSGDRRYLEGQFQRLEDFVEGLYLADIVDTYREFTNY